MYKPRTLGDAVDKIARQSAGKDWGLYANLLDRWVEIVGAEYAHVTTPVKITFPYQPNVARRLNGTLTVRLPKGLAMEFSFKSDLIRQRINSYFGYEAFARIVLDPASLLLPQKARVLKADPAAVKKIKDTASSIENNELREALERFGEAMLAQKG